MIIDFNEQEHVYSVNGDIASISVTELLAKHGLAPNYGDVDKEFLKEFALEGKRVHKDLENVLNLAGYTPETEQGKQYDDYVRENFSCGVGEQMLAYDYNGLLIAGTADVMAITKQGKYVVADHKNTSQFHREYVTWQVNILDYMARKLGEEKVNGKLLKWKGADVFYCFKYNPKGGEMSVYQLEKIDDREIEKLIECEYKHEIYQRPELVVEQELALQVEQAEQYLMEVQNTLKQAEQNAKTLREQMLKLFENQNIKSWQSPSGLKVTYVPPIERMVVDSSKLKKNYKQIYDKCLKVSKVKSSLRVTIKGDGDE